MGHIYRTTCAKSGCKLVTLFDSYSYDGLSAGIWVIHIGPKSGCKLVTLFDSYRLEIYLTMYYRLEIYLTIYYRLQLTIYYILTMYYR